MNHKHVHVQNIYTPRPVLQTNVGLDQGQRGAAGSAIESHNANRKVVLALRIMQRYRGCQQYRLHHQPITPKVHHIDGEDEGV